MGKSSAVDSAAAAACCQRCTGLLSCRWQASGGRRSAGLGGVLTVTESLLSLGLEQSDEEMRIRLREGCRIRLHSAGCWATAKLAREFSSTAFRAMLPFAGIKSCDCI